MPSTPFVSIAASGDDGRVAKYGALTSYPPSNAAGEDFASSSVYAIRGFDGTSQEVSSPLLRFDLRPYLPSSATPTAGTLRIKIWEVQNADVLSVTADYFTWTGTPSTDFAQTAGTNAISGILLSSLSNGVVDLPLTGLSGISTSTYTYLRLHISNRASDAAPVGYNDIRFYAFEDPVEPEPKLSVAYTIPPPTGLIATVLGG